MRGWVVLLGIILLALGASQFIEIPYATQYSAAAIGFIPYNGYLVTLILIVLGVLLVIVGAKLSKMGKWFNFY